MVYLIIQLLEPYILFILMFKKIPPHTLAVYPFLGTVENGIMNLIIFPCYLFIAHCFYYHGKVIVFPSVAWMGLVW